MRGDTGALRRMQIQDSRHDRAAHVLKLRLDQTKRKRRNYQSCADHHWHVIGTHGLKCAGPILGPAAHYYGIPRMANLTPMLILFPRDAPA